MMTFSPGFSPATHTVRIIPDCGALVLGSCTVLKQDWKARHCANSVFFLVFGDILGHIQFVQLSGDIIRNYITVSNAQPNVVGSCTGICNAFKLLIEFCTFDMMKE